MSETDSPPDRDRAVALARRLEAGYTYLNGHGPAAQDSRGPFGGFKDSGIGRENGVQAIDNYTQTKNVCANIDRR